MSIKIFFCYAHEDELLLDKLKSHLRPLQRQGFINIWYDRDISAGAEWEQEIGQHLNTADIILLMISADFMNSDYCYGIEMKRAIERHDRGEARVIPIILRHVYWQGKPLGKLQALPTDAIPVTDPSWNNLDKALFNVAEGIREIIKAINKERARKLREEQERKLREEQERKLREEQERKLREEQERKLREEQERKLREEQERKLREEQERKLQEELDRRNAFVASSQLPNGGWNTPAASSQLPNGGWNTPAASSQLPNGGWNTPAASSQLPNGGWNTPAASSQLPNGGWNTPAASSQLPNGGWNTPAASSQLPNGGWNTPSPIRQLPRRQIASQQTMKKPWLSKRISCVLGLCGGLAIQLADVSGVILILQQGSDGRPLWTSNAGVNAWALICMLFAFLLLLILTIILLVHLAQSKRWGWFIGILLGTIGGTAIVILPGVTLIIFGIIGIKRSSTS